MLLIFRCRNVMADSIFHDKIVKMMITSIVCSIFLMANIYYTILVIKLVCTSCWDRVGYGGEQKKTYFTCYGHKRM